MLYKLCPKGLKNKNSIHFFCRSVFKIQDFVIKRFICKKKTWWTTRTWAKGGGGRGEAHTTRTRRRMNQCVKLSLLQRLRLKKNNLSHGQEVALKKCIMWASSSEAFCINIYIHRKYSGNQLNRNSLSQSKHSTGHVVQVM